MLGSRETAQHQVPTSNMMLLYMMHDMPHAACIAMYRLLQTRMPVHPTNAHNGMHTYCIDLPPVGPELYQHTTVGYTLPSFRQLTLGSAVGPVQCHCRREAADPRRDQAQSCNFRRRRRPRRREGGSVMRLPPTYGTGWRKNSRGNLPAKE